MNSPFGVSNFFQLKNVFNIKIIHAHGDYSNIELLNMLAP